MSPAPVVTRSTALRSLLDHGVDLSEVPGRLRARWSRLLWFTAGAAILVYAATFLMRPWYASGSSLTVDTGRSPSVSGAGALLGLAGQVGLSLGQGASPQFYVSVLQSRNLQERVLQAHYPLGVDGARMTLARYWTGTDQPAPRKLEAARNRLQQHVSAEADPRTGIVTYTVEGPTPSTAQLMADTALAALNDIVISIRARKASEERKFLEARWQVVGDSLRGQEQRMRTFLEANRTVDAPRLELERARLARSVDQILTVYGDVARQLEQARFEEVRNTPVVAVLDAPERPVRRSSPRRTLLALTAAAVGLALAMLLTLLELAADRAARDQTSAAPSR